jgi:hypothetical protein
MACERFRDALAEVAAGAAAPAAVDAHLASCEACREELAALRRALALADAEMAGLLATEPSPELAARIRGAVAEAEPSPGWRFGWLWPAVAAAATLLVALVVVMGRGTPPGSGPRVAVDAHRPQSAGGTGAREPVGEPVAPADRPVPGADGHHLVTPRSSGQAERREGRRPGGSLLAGQNDARRDDSGAARPPAAGRRATPAEPEVLVPPGEAEALLRFATLVHRDRYAPAAFLALGQPSADLAQPAALDIQPLEIVPLDPAETSGT